MFMQNVCDNVCHTRTVYKTSVLHRHIINEIVKCYSSLVVSGFSRNEFNSCALFKFYCWFIFLFGVKIKGGG